MGRASLQSFCATVSLLLSSKKVSVDDGGRVRALSPRAHGDARWGGKGKHPKSGDLRHGAGCKVTARASAPTWLWLLPVPTICRTNGHCQPDFKAWGFSG